ncbi:MAG: PEP-CTERM sorting domain-containing protein [Phycisphaerales bacterium]|nr:PEP-CTERM sorting domain-containing protein [Phycisphaerales bacterium]
MRLSVCTAAAAAVMSFGAVASADIINIQGLSSQSTEGLGHFTGSIEYNYLSGSSGQLLINLTNTSPVENGGYITALIFNIGAPQRSGTDTATLQFASFPAFENIPGPGIGGSPFGLFDAGAGIIGQFEGGGNPTQGIGVGQSGMFEFLVDSAYADVLSAASFISGPNDFNFVVRFRGFANGGSDKVPVPVPGSVALLGLGAVAMSSRRRRNA